MADRCCWPGCRDVQACVYLGKLLCDKHCDLVMSEDAGVAARSRKKIGLPPITEWKAPEVPEVAKEAEVVKEEKEEEFDLSSFQSRLDDGDFD